MAIRKPSHPSPERVDPLGWIKIPNVTEGEGFAIRALAEGNATEHQQREALKFIIERACRTDEPSFVLDSHGGDRATSYVEGRKSVGHALRAILALPAEQLRKKQA